MLLGPISFAPLLRPGPGPEPGLGPLSPVPGSDYPDATQNPLGDCVNSVEVAPSHPIPSYPPNAIIKDLNVTDVIDR